MKRIFAFLASAVLACSLLAAPCFAAEPEPLPGVTDPEQPESDVYYPVMPMDVQKPGGDMA